MWKELGLLLYQQHKCILLPSYPLSHPSPALTPSSSADSTSTANTPATDIPATDPTTDESTTGVGPISSDDYQKRQDLVTHVYERSASCFRRAAAINPKDWVYLFNFIIVKYVPNLMEIIYPYMLGKISEKCGKPLTVQYLFLYISRFLFFVFFCFPSFYIFINCLLGILNIVSL